MSRSYKKHPIITDRKTNGKFAAKRKYRRNEIDHIGKSNIYKKQYPQYDICDYVIYWTLNDNRRWYADEGWTDNEIKRDWYAHCKGK